MIQEKPQFTIVMDDSMPSTKFNLKEENLAHVFGILRSNLYSDKILAVIREYSCNAHDANVENGRPQKPIVVTLPTVYDPVFKVRDNGMGLSEDDVFNIFSSYGASTKRNTNKLIGTLGMGSKSGFGYADSFTVTSWHGGYKKVYEAFIDETQIGTIAKVHQEKSSDPTGLEITIGVKASDTPEFIRKAEQFYKWFKPMPVFKGVDILPRLIQEKSSNTVVYESDICEIFKERYRYGKQLFVRMGNITYPVTDLVNIDIAWLNDATMVLNVEMGSVSFTTSRESLEMTPKTITTINNRLKELAQEITGSVQDKINACENPWSALVYTGNLPNIIRGLVGLNLNWRGEALKNNFHNKMDFATYVTYRSQWVRTAINIFRNDLKLAIIVNDGGYPASELGSRLKKARETAHSKADTVLYARGTVADSKEFLGSKELIGATVIKLSDMYPIVKGSRASVTKDKRKANILLWNKTTLYPESRNWDIVGKTPDGVKVYVTLSGYTSSIDTHSINILNKLGDDIVLYGVRDTSTLNDSWVKLDDYIEQKALELLEDDKFQEDFLHRNVQNMRSLGGLGKGHLNRLECKLAKKLLSCHKISDNTFNSKQIFVSAVAHRSDAVREKQNILLIKSKAIEEEYNELSTSLFAKYPLLLGGNAADHYIDYINAMTRFNA